MFCIQIIQSLFLIQIIGNDSAFLFTLRPKMRCFPTSGYNDHYQYLNLHQQTMPNGLVRLLLIIHKYSNTPILKIKSIYLISIYREWAANSTIGVFGWTASMVMVNALTHAQHLKTILNYQSISNLKFGTSRCGRLARSRKMKM